MKDFYKVEPDRVKLLNKHFTPGRGGSKIKYIVRHHNAGMLSIDQIWQVWQDREASAHYQVTVDGEVGQLVWDGDTAWHAANSVANRESIGIEHANSAGSGQDWPISDATIREGARLAAALCRFYGLGRPEFGKNIFDHRRWTSTSCPHHLAQGGKYHDQWMREAQSFYDALVAGRVNPDGSPKSGSVVEDEGISVSEADRIIKHITDFIKGFVGPIGSDVKDNRQQLTGGRDMGQYPGWAQLGQDSQGRNLTLVDAVAALRRDVARMEKKLDEKEGGR